MGPTFVVDNGEAGHVEVSGTWANSIIAGVSSSNTRYSGDASGAETQWRFYVDTAGTYDVDVSWGAHSGRKENVRYRVTHSSGTADQYYDQNDPPQGWSGWFTHGLYHFDAGPTYNVSLVPDGAINGSFISADSIYVRLNTADSAGPTVSSILGIASILGIDKLIV